MTRKGSKHKHKRTAGKEPRKPTKAEVRANNEASTEAEAAICNVSRWVGCIEEELAAMNDGKVGSPYKYCQTMIVWALTMMGYDNLTFRKTAGRIREALRPYGLKAPSRSTLHRRMQEYVDSVVFGPPLEDNRIIARSVSTNVLERLRRMAVDSTGLNLTATTLWRKNKWGVGPDYRGWLKLHVLADVDTDEIIAWVLTDDSVGDSQMFDYLFGMAVMAGHRIDVTYADNAYDSIDHWKLLEDKKVTFVTRFKSNTNGHCNGSMARGQVAKLWLKVGPEEWAVTTGYGMRWKVECTFSDFKRLISEYISATSERGWVREVFQKVRAFDIHKQVRADLLGTTGNGVVVAGV